MLTATMALEKPPIWTAQCIVGRMPNTAQHTNTDILICEVTLNLGTCISMAVTKMPATSTVYKCRRNCII